MRTTGNGDSPNIVVQFTHRAKRDCFLEKARKKRLTTEDIDLEPCTPIYINEHLCPAMKRLFGVVNGKKRKHSAGNMLGIAMARSSPENLKAAQLFPLSILSQDLQKMT